MEIRETNTRKKYFIIAAIIAVILVASIVTAVVMSRSTGSKETKSVAAAQTTEQKGIVSYVGEKDKTALAQLKQVGKDVVTQTSSYGEYVDRINGLKGGTDGKYWSFYIDGKMASVGAGQYICKGGEKIEWKFEKAQ